MKIRTGFVSNSSSASFTVRLDDISTKDAFRLLEFQKVPADWSGRTWTDSWNIEVNLEQGRIFGWTSMDNGDLSEYLEKYGVNSDKFQWESD